LTRAHIEFTFQARGVDANPNFDEEFLEDQYRRFLQDREVNHEADESF